MIASIHPLALVAAILLVVVGFNADHFPPWTSFHAEVPAFAASASLLVAAALRGDRLRVTSAVWLLLALIASAWVQFGAGLVPYAGDAWIATAYLLVLAAAWLWGYGSARSDQPQQASFIVAVVLILLGLLASWQVMAQWLNVVESFGGWVFGAVYGRPAGNFGQPNQTATLLLMASVGVALFVVQGRLSRRSAWPLLLLMGWCVVLTQSRTALVSVATLTLLLLFLCTRSATLRPYRLDVACWGIYVFAAAWVLQNVTWDVTAPAVGAQLMVQVGLRPLMWKQMAAGLLESPWTGYGWLQVAKAQQVGALKVPGLEQTNYAHNAGIDALIFLGLPAGLLVIGLCIAWTVRRLRALDATSRPAAAGLLMLWPVAVHSQLELPHAYAFVLVPAGMLLGAFDAQTEGAVARTWRLPRLAWGAAAAGWIALLAALGYEYMLVEEDYRVNRFENRRLGQTPSDYAPPSLHLLTNMEEALQAMRLRAKPGMPPEDLDLLKRVSARYTWAPMHYRTALALALNGRPDEAGHQLRVIKNMFPPHIYAEGRSDWILMREGQYPQLERVVLP